jgi:hypothetical protein
VKLEIEAFGKKRELELEENLKIYMCERKRF